MARAIDVLLGALAIIAPSLLLLADQVVSALPPYHHIKLTPGLIGVSPTTDPPPTLAGVLSGRWQADFARLIGTLTPVYPFAVRLKNQVLLSAFGLSGIPAVVVGRGGVLVEPGYLEEYCHRDLATFRRQAQGWAPKLRQMQDGYASRGKVFLYVITPSKVSQNPAIIPFGYPCPASQAERDEVLPLWRQALDAAGVHYVDTTEPLRVAQGQYPFRLFPQGGTHWNTVGAAVAARAVIAGLQIDALPPPEFVWSMAPRPIWPDDDLASLMNVLTDLRAFAVPRAVLRNTPAGRCRQLSVAIVGGSFMNRIAEALAQGPCAPHVEEWQYWSAYDITWPPGPPLPPGVDPVRRAAALRAADVLIYEENEEVMARSRHGPELWSFLQQ